MSDKKISTESYKGVRDFFPADMAIQRYIFDTWSKTAEAFGFERYDASVLEPAELYKSKGAENEELVNEQTYTFVDRGDREVTLRPEMTPTVARMVAAKRRGLNFPVRWYSIPNLFRYERPQRGRLREHWQLNCDIFGGDQITSDIELISLAYQTLIDFGATPEMFEVHINSRVLLNDLLDLMPDLGEEDRATVLGIIDRKLKMSAEEFRAAYQNISGINATLLENFINSSTLDELAQVFTEKSGKDTLSRVIEELGALGIPVKFNPVITRGFNYYTGTIFEIFDASSENNRSLMGGGRYDNLTSMFGGDPISGVGFGMGDVTMRDFLETHNLLNGKVPKSSPTLSILPAESTDNRASLGIAQSFRARGLKTVVDTSNKKIGKKISAAAEADIAYIIVVGSAEQETATYTLKDLTLGTTQTGSIEELVAFLLANA